MTSDRRSPMQMAAARVTAAQKAVERSKARVKTASDELVAAQAARKAAETALHYAEQHPLLHPEEPPG